MFLGVADFRRGCRRTIAGLALVGLLIGGLGACGDDTRDRIGEAIEDSDRVGGSDGEAGAGDDGVDPDDGGDAGESDDGGDAAEPEDPGDGADPGGGGDEPSVDEPVEAPIEPGTDTDDDGLSGQDWLVVLLLGGAALALLLGAARMASGRSERRAAARSTLSTGLAEIVGGSRWVHDQGTIDVLRVSDPEQLRSVWSSVRQRMIDVEQRASTLAMSGDDPTAAATLQQLAEAMANLRSAVESDVAVRIDPETDGPLRQSASQTVYERRRELATCISAAAVIAR